MFQTQSPPVIFYMNSILKRFHDSYKIELISPVHGDQSSEGLLSVYRPYVPYECIHNDLDLVD